jgi:hypothetical protein
MLTFCSSKLFEDNPISTARCPQGDVGLIPEFCSDFPYIIETQIHQKQLLVVPRARSLSAPYFTVWKSFLSEAVLPLNKYLKKKFER